MKIYVSAFLATCMIAAGPASATEFIQNGNFASGLTNWTTYNTANGTSSPTTTNFDVTGLGVSSAFVMQVGTAVFMGFNQPPQGGGVFQNINLATSGKYNFKADIASFNTGAFDNSSGGIFSLLIDGLPVANFDSGFISASSVIRSSITFGGDLLAGTHSFSVQAARPFTPATVFQYATNISLQNTAAGAVPEPAAWVLMIGGFGMVGVTMRRRAVRTNAVSA